MTIFGFKVVSTTVRHDAKSGRVVVSSFPV